MPDPAHVSPSPAAEAPPRAPEPRVFRGPVLIGLGIYVACLVLVLVLYHTQ